MFAAHQTSVGAETDFSFYRNDRPGFATVLSLTDDPRKAPPLQGRGWGGAVGTESSFPILPQADRPHPNPSPEGEGLKKRAPAACIPDDRFRQLLGDADWFSLPATTRARFGRKAVGSRTITYLGEVTHYETGFAGRALAQIARLIGGPLPLHADLGIAAAVTVTEDEAEGGQIWTRQYGRHRGFPQMIHSVKRFAGSTGLEEYLGRGFGIALKLRVAGGALYFDSDHYFLRVGKRRFPLPRWLTPGALTIGHIDHGDGWFTFTLDLAHPVFGRLMHQQCRFTEAVTGTLQ